MKFFLDANVPIAVRDFLAISGQVMLARDHAMSGATDKDVADFAFRHDAILVTRDMEFSNPTLFPLGSHFGMLMIRVPHFSTALQIANTVRASLVDTDMKELVDSITVVEPGRTVRLRRFGKLHNSDQ